MDKRLRDYTIVFSGLKPGTHHFEYSLDARFFDIFGFDEFAHPSLLVKVEMNKQANMLEFSFSLKGDVQVVCDVSGAEFTMPLEGDFFLVVKFGEEYNDEDDEILILPQGAYEVNLGQQLYELAVLSLPAKRVHPEVEAGKLKNETVEKLKQLDPDHQTQKEEKTDPRWDKLKDLLN